MSRKSCIIKSILASRRLKNSLPGNTIGRHSDATLQAMSRNVTSVYCPKRSNTSLMVTSNCCQYLLIAGRTCQWILWWDCLYLWIERAIVTTRSLSLSTSWRRWYITSQCKSRSILDNWQPITSLYLQVLIFLILLLRHQAKSLYRLPPSNQRPNRTPRWKLTSMPLSISSKTTSNINGQVCLQQCEKC